ncbi:sarcosine oxidase subunit delta [Enterovibrio sp. Hal110]
MLRIYCPYCEELREEPEFTYSGEAHIIRPLDPDALSERRMGSLSFPPQEYQRQPP